MPAKYNTKKKLVSKIGYKKNTAVTDPSQLIPLITGKDAQMVFMKAQTIYDDNSESMLLEIHFSKTEE